MRWVYKLGILGAVLPNLAGCGFTPVYKTDATTPDIHSKLSKIYINTIPEKQGVILYNQLVDLLHKNGTPITPEYRLITTVSVNSFTTAIKRNNESSRGVVRVEGEFELITADISKTFKSRSECGYTVVKNPYASDTAEQNASERCLRDIGQDAYRQLSLYFRDEIMNQ